MLFSSEQLLYCTVLYTHKTTILCYPVLHTSVYKKTKEDCDIAVIHYILLYHHSHHRDNVTAPHGRPNLRSRLHFCHAQEGRPRSPQGHMGGGGGYCRYVIVGATILLAVRKSYSSRAAPIICRRKLQIIFNNPFTMCQRAWQLKEDFASSYFNMREVMFYIYIYIYIYI